MVFRSDFLWGTATSSHQVEGDNRANDWWDWEQAPGHIRDGTTSGAALGWWAGAAEDDLRRARDLGQNAHRLSLEWSRLEPEPGRFDDAAFDRYSQIFQHAGALGLKLSVTLNHFTVPMWVARRGGWLWKGVADAFVRFATLAVERFGAHVHTWATFNEPNVLAYMGYAGKRWPPGLGSMQAGMRAYGAMLRAHALAYRAIKSRTPGARIGIVFSLPIFDAESPRRRDRAPAWLSDWAFSGAALHGLATGWLLPPLPPERVKGLRRAFDWFGVNYYGRYTVRFDPASPEFFGRRPNDTHVRTDWTDWGEPAPESFERRLVGLARFGVPLYVTENGIRDEADTVRPRFLEEHVDAMARAIGRGADVRGYFHWSLVDNFEWAEGWSSHFGLIEFDRATGRRTPRGSAETYARICARASAARFD